MLVAGGRGKEAEAETEIYAQGNPGVKKLSPEHCLVLVLGDPPLLLVPKALVPIFSCSEAGLFDFGK